MRQTQQLALVLAILALAGVAGCSSQASEAPASTSTKPAAPKPQRRALRSAHNETATAIYNNPEYGVSFHYPRQFVLIEGSPENDLGSMRTQDDFDSEQPGATLLATILVPDDAYPNTSFRDAWVQYAVNPGMSAEACRETVVAKEEEVGEEGEKERRGTTMIGGILFAWVEGEGAVKRTAAEPERSFHREYAGFANGGCQEFLVQVEVGTSGDESTERQADGRKILRQLERIIVSLQTGRSPADTVKAPAAP